MNDLIDNFLRATLWIWLPFTALIKLTRELLEKMEKRG